MKKYFFLFIMLGCFFTSCSELVQKNNLADMRDSFERHIKAKDKENGMASKIEMLHAISYKELNDDEKVEPEDAYLTKIYWVAQSWYIGGSRVYNTNDTVEVYFNKNKRFLRIK